MNSRICIHVFLSFCREQHRSCLPEYFLILFKLYILFSIILFYLIILNIKSQDVIFRFILYSLFQKLEFFNFAKGIFAYLW